jgi:hypothetical protein
MRKHLLIGLAVAASVCSAAKRPILSGKVTDSEGPRCALLHVDAFGSV